MNSSFYKILKFELKLNFKIWLLLLASSFALLTFFFFMVHADHNSFVIGGSFIPTFILISCLFTLLSYPESTTKQTMAMYHLLPASGNTKFFSKQLITFWVFPILLLLLYLVFVLVVDPLVFDRFNRSLLSPNFHPIRTLKMYLWAHSIVTLLAIILKKRKLLYTIILLFSFQTIIGIAFFVSQLIFTNLNISFNGFFVPLNFMKELPEITHFLVPILFYLVSYRLFFKRQL